MRHDREMGRTPFVRIGRGASRFLGAVLLLLVPGGEGAALAQESAAAVRAELVGFEFGPTAAHPYGRPNPEAPPELDQYAFMIGDFGCDVTYKEYREGAWVVTGEGRARWVARYVMNGRAIMDEFVDDWGDALNVRVFDPDTGKWLIHYSRVNPASVAQMSAEQQDGRMVMLTDRESPGGYTYVERVAFEPQGADRYRWTQEVVYSPESAVVIADIACVREGG